jgi:4a-hydroxytetrahydrobiopterin dehydratase
MATLSDADANERLTRLEGWRLASGEAQPSIERDLEFDDFAAALAFVDRVGEAAQDAGHHPDIFLHGWNKVRLTLSTHSAGGLTDADFALAGRVDGLL